VGSTGGVLEVASVTATGVGATEITPAGSSVVPVATVVGSTGGVLEVASVTASVVPVATVVGSTGGVLEVASVTATGVGATELTPATSGNAVPAATVVGSFTLTFLLTILCSFIDYVLYGPFPGRLSTLSRDNGCGGTCSR